jgi:ADP-ribosyl-[dinitrogen reductase] hydrolase
MKKISDQGVNNRQLIQTMTTMNPASDEKRAGAIWGTLIGDALAMPVHWYYDRSALHRDYGVVRYYVTPRNPHPDSILWRSSYTPLNQRGDILHEQAQYWGQRGIHYHQFLRAGENTLNLQLGRVLTESLIARGRYDAEDYLRRYLEFMLTPGRHRDTYAEECHRKFFTAYARGSDPRKCGGSDIHIGGLAHVGVLCAFLGGGAEATRRVVREHVELTHRASEVLNAADGLVRILAAVLDGGGLREAIFAQGSDWLSRRTAEKWSREPDDVVIGQRVSPACYIADAFPASLYLAWKYADDFEAGLVANTNLGAVVGALLGAAAGITRIPARLCQGLHTAAALGRQVNGLAATRTEHLPASTRALL